MTGSSRDIIFPIAIALIVINALVIFSIRPYGYRASSMIRISQNEMEGAVPEYFQKGMVIFDDKGGYDGQFYYYAARDPFLTEGLFKNPYRQQRILYPLLSWAAAFGNETLIPYTMYLVNLASVALGMYFFILILKGYSLSPYWSLFYGLSPPSIMTIQYDLPSPLSMFLIIAAVYFYLRDKYITTSVLFSLAFLTREDSIVVFAPLLLFDFLKHRRFLRVFVFAASLVPFFLWQAFLRIKLGALPTGTSASVINKVPFMGIVDYFTSVEFTGVVQALKLLSVLIVLFYFATVFFSLLGPVRRKGNLFYYVVMAYCLLVPFTVASQWDNYNGLLRMFFGLFVFITLSYAVERDKNIKNCVYFVGFLTALTAVRILFISPVYPFSVW